MQNACCIVYNGFHGTTVYSTVCLLNRYTMFSMNNNMYDVEYCTTYINPNPHGMF